MSTNPNPQPETADPCAPYTDAQGNFDVVAWIDGVVGAAECGIEQARAILNELGIKVLTDFMEALSKLKNIQDTSHIQY